MIRVAPHFNLHQSWWRHLHLRDYASRRHFSLNRLLVNHLILARN